MLTDRHVRSGKGVVKVTSLLQGPCPTLFTAATLALYFVLWIRLSKVFSLSVGMSVVESSSTVSVSSKLPSLSNSSTTYDSTGARSLLHGLVHATRTDLWRCLELTANGASGFPA